MLSGGPSGLAATHSDIGGYTMVVVPNETSVLRSRELLLRWMEMSAFSDTIFRSHVGNLPNASAQATALDAIGLWWMWCGVTGLWWMR